MLEGSRVAPSVGEGERPAAVAIDALLVQLGVLFPLVFPLVRVVFVPFRPLPFGCLPDHRLAVGNVIRFVIFAHGFNINNYVFV